MIRPLIAAVAAAGAIAGLAIVAAPVASADVYYETCADARADNAAPMREGDPGYSPHLDRDHDGIACE